MELLARPSLGGIPLLVLANKRDLPGALSSDQLIAAMYVLHTRDSPLFSMRASAACTFCDILLFDVLSMHRDLASISDREVTCYSISAKYQQNIDIALEWLIQQSKKRRAQRAS